MFLGVQTEIINSCDNCNYGIYFMRFNCMKYNGMLNYCCVNNELKLIWLQSRTESMYLCKM